MQKLTITKFKIRQYILMTGSTNLMHTKLSRYTVTVKAKQMMVIEELYCGPLHWPLTFSCVTCLGRSSILSLGKANLMKYHNTF